MPNLKMNGWFGASLAGLRYQWFNLANGARKKKNLEVWNDYSSLLIDLYNEYGSLFESHRCYYLLMDSWAKVQKYPRTKVLPEEVDFDK